MVNKMLCKNGHDRFTKNGFSRGIKQIYKCVRCHATSIFFNHTKFIVRKKVSQGKKNIAGALHQLTYSDADIAVTLEISVTVARKAYKEGNINPDNAKHCKFPKVVHITKNNLSEIIEPVIEKDSRLLFLDLKGEKGPVIYTSSTAIYSILSETR